ncbi:MAG: glycosyl hydrolase [Planctomycetota bacterium]|nr:glycosyl hydrolase [Planctomycetota bacterium]
MKAPVCFLKWSLIASMFLFDVGNPVSAADDLLSGYQPREIGPTLFGGRVVDIEVDPGSAHHIFVASASGGLWESTNNGTTWDNIFQDQGTISIGDVAIDPQDSRVLWVGTGEANNQRSSLWGDGIYKTTDGGKSWNRMGLQDTHHIGRVVVDPRNSDVVYVAALGHLYSANSERGLYKTTDGGKTWEKILFVNEKVGVVDLVMDPRNPDNLFAATYERMRRAWNFDGAGPGSAIYKSADGGKSWKKLSAGLPAGEIGRIGLAIFAGDPKILYAAISNQNLVLPEEKSADSKNPKNAGKQAENGKRNSLKTPYGFDVQQAEGDFFVTGLPKDHPARKKGLKEGCKIIRLGGVEARQGSSFVAHVQQLRSTDRLEMVFEKEGQELTLELVVVPPRKSLPRPIGGEVYRSADGGESWKKVNRQPVGGTPAYYYGQIRIDPSDPDRLYLLSIPLYSSTDGGKNWTTLARSVHVDHHALWINPTAPHHLMLGNDGGFHQSHDYGQTMDHYLNIPLAQFYALTVDMQEPYHIYGGTQDNGSWGGSSRGGSRGGRVGPFDWYRIGGGDGFYVQVDPKDANLFFAESQFGALYRGNRETGERKSIRPRPVDAREKYRFNWNSPILMSQHDARVIYFGGNRLFKSMNQGDDWEVISDDLTTADPEKLQGNVPHCTLTTIAESRFDRKMLLVGTDDGKVQLTTDGGRSWSDLSGSFPFRPTEWWCSRVEFSVHDSRTLYASFTGYREDDFRCFLYRSTNLGESWQSVAGDLPAEPVNVIKEDRVNPQLLYVGTEFGCYITVNGGKNWNVLPGMPRVSVQDLVVHPTAGDLVLATHGRGFFIVDDVTPLQQLQEESPFPVQVFKPRPIRRFRVRQSPSLSGDRGYWGEGQKEAGRLWYRVREVTEDRYLLKVTDAAGKLVHSSVARNQAGLYPVRVVSSRGSRGRRNGRQPPEGSTGTAVIQVVPGTYQVDLVKEKTGEKQSTQLLVE